MFLNLPYSLSQRYDKIRKMFQAFFWNYINIEITCNSNIVNLCQYLMFWFLEQAKFYCHYLTVCRQLRLRNEKYNDSIIIILLIISIRMTISSQAFLTTPFPEWHENANSNGTHLLWGSYYTLLAVFIYTGCALLILHSVQSFILSYWLYWKKFSWTFWKRYS